MNRSPFCRMVQLNHAPCAKIIFFAMLSFLSNFLIPTSFATQLFDNENDGTPLYQLVEKAKSSIDIEIYEMTDPTLKGLLRKAIRKGLLVRIVAEPQPVGSSCRLFSADNGAVKSLYNSGENTFENAVLNTPTENLPNFNLFNISFDGLSPSEAQAIECQDLKKLLTEVRESGGVFVPFNKQKLCGRRKGSLSPVKGKIAGKPNDNFQAACFEHGKMAIIDSKVAMISTGNYADSAFCNKASRPSRCNRDYSYVINNPLYIKRLSEIFEKDLQGKSYDLKAIIDSQQIPDLMISPLSRIPLEGAISSAEKTIIIQNQYLRDEHLNQTIIEAARRGVKIKIQVASLCSFGRPSQNGLDQWQRVFQAMENVGVKIRAFTTAQLVGGRPGYLHAKAMVIDGNKAWIGSVNGSTNAIDINREFGIFFYDEDDITKLTNKIRGDFSDERSSTWQDDMNCGDKIQ